MLEISNVGPKCNIADAVCDVQRCLVFALVWSCWCLTLQYCEPTCTFQECVRDHLFLIISHYYHGLVHCEKNSMISSCISFLSFPHSCYWIKLFNKWLFPWLEDNCEGCQLSWLLDFSLKQTVRKRTLGGIQEYKRGPGKRGHSLCHKLSIPTVNYCLSDTEKICRILWNKWPFWKSKR